MALYYIFMMYRYLLCVFQLTSTEKVMQTSKLVSIHAVSHFEICI